VEKSAHAVSLWMNALRSYTMGTEQLRCCVCIELYNAVARRQQVGPDKDGRSAAGQPRDDRRSDAGLSTSSTVCLDSHCLVQ